MTHRAFCIAAVATALMALFLGCTPKKPVGRVLSSPDAAWNVFRNNYNTPPVEPSVLIKASLYYTRVKPMRRTNRTLVTMWGNFGDTMRLDLAAGIGKLIAHIREDSNELLIFYPTEKRAYAHADPILGATRLGMPFPFSLSKLASVICGDFSQLVPAGYVQSGIDKMGYTYDLHDALISRIVLDTTGRPILLEGRTSKAYDTAQEWRLEINQYEDESATTPLPGKLTLSLENGEKGVLRIKSRELRQATWDTQSLHMNLPEGVFLQRLDTGYKPSENRDIPMVYEEAK